MYPSALGRQLGVHACAERFDFRAYPLYAHVRLKAIAMSLMGQFLSGQRYAGDNILKKWQSHVRRPREKITPVGGSDALEALVYLSWQHVGMQHPGVEQ
jgi:hypothetical protein